MIAAGLLEQFTKETGIKVIYSTYESNESHVRQAPNL